MRSGLPTYVFFLVNHLGEPFEAHQLEFPDEHQALSHAQILAARQYPVEVRLNGELIKLIPMAVWRAEDWLKPYLGPWPLI